MLTTGRLALVVALAALAFAAWQLIAPAERDAAKTVADGTVALVSKTADARFTVASANLELQRQTTGGYAGTAMPEGALLVRADAASYCVQVGNPGVEQHLAGPGGTATAGPC